MLFENILRGLNILKEDASVDDINDAITNMHPAEIRYTSEYQDKAEGERIIYPVAYGISTAGNPVIRAFEDSGDSASRVPAWKLFLLSNIKSWKTRTEESFEGEELSGLNKSGEDKQIETLYNISPLSGSSRGWRKEGDPEITSIPVSKADVKDGGTYTAREIVDDTLYSARKSGSSENIDYSENSSYNTLKPEVRAMTAEPETEPYLKKDIDNGGQDVSDEVQVQEPEDNSKAIYASNEPITQGDVNGGEDPEEENELADTYNDYMSRWYKGEDDEEE